MSPRSALRAACVAALTLVAAGCGSQTTTAPADERLADQLRESAERRQEQAATAATTTTAPPATTATTATTPAATAPEEPAARGLISRADRASFARLARRLPGREGLGVATLGSDPAVTVLGGLKGGVAWSSSKVPVVMAATRAGAGTQRDARLAITASDNAAAERLWTALGSGTAAAAAADEQLRAAGDTRTQIQSRRLLRGYTAFGQTEWALADQARFMAGLACAPEGPAVLGLMNEVVAGQRWGLAARGRDAQVKGGWGPALHAGQAGGWLERQMGVVVLHGTPVAVTIASTAPGHSAGIAALNRLAAWAVSHVDLAGAPSEPDC